MTPIPKKRWVVYAKPPFAGPDAVLTYLSRYARRVAIPNSRLLRFDETSVTFHPKNVALVMPSEQRLDLPRSKRYVS